MHHTSLVSLSRLCRIAAVVCLTVWAATVSLLLEHSFLLCLLVGRCSKTCWLAQGNGKRVPAHLFRSFEHRKRKGTIGIAIAAGDCLAAFQVVIPRQHSFGNATTAMQSRNIHIQVVFYEGTAAAGSLVTFVFWNSCLDGNESTAKLRVLRKSRRPTGDCGTLFKRNP